MKEWEKVICSRDRVSWRSKGKNMCPHPQNRMQTQREKKEVENKTQGIWILFLSSANQNVKRSQRRMATEQTQEPLVYVHAPNIARTSQRI